MISFQVRSALKTEFYVVPVYKLSNISLTYPWSQSWEGFLASLSLPTVWRSFYFSFRRHISVSSLISNIIYLAFSSQYMLLTIIFALSLILLLLMLLLPSTSSTFYQKANICSALWITQLLLIFPACKVLITKSVLVAAEIHSVWHITHIYSNEKWRNSSHKKSSHFNPFHESSTCHELLV